MGSDHKGCDSEANDVRELLTASKHEQLIEKVCACFEDEALHLTDRHQWLALKPQEQQWISARQIIQHLDLTMRICCKQDLKQEEFEELEKAILYGDAIDAQILGIIKRFPKQYFHIGMIPDMRNNFANADVDTDAQDQIEAEHAKCQAAFRLFKRQLNT